MNIALSIFSIINLILIVVFMIATSFVCNQKNRPGMLARYSIFLAVLFIIYFISIFSILVFALIEHKYLTLFMSMFLFIPFIIGKYVSYDKLRLYSNIQLFILFLSLFISLSMIKFE